MSGSPPIPPQAPPTWTYTPEHVVARAQDAIAQKKAVNDRIAALADHECTFDSIPIALAEGLLDSIVDPLCFLQHAAPNEALRTASAEASTLVSDFKAEQYMRPELFRAVTSAHDHLKSSGAWDKLGSEERRLIERMVLDGRREGLGLDEEGRDALKAMRKEERRASMTFLKNYSQSTASIEFTTRDLDGVPEDVLSGYPTKDTDVGKVHIITFKNSDILPVLKFAHSPETRRRVQEGMDSYIPENEALFEEVIKLRRDMARVLGYKCWADYVLEVMMIKGSEKAWAYMQDLEAKLLPFGQRDRERFLELKKEEHEKRGYPFDGELYIWDYWYYDRLSVERSLKLDEGTVREYFPVENTISAILDIYQDLLGLKFVEAGYGEADVWYPGVRQFAAWDRTSDGGIDESSFVGYFYIDPYPRPSKFPHAAVWSLLPGCSLTPTQRVYPVAALLANFPRETPSVPALMRHAEVVTLFHEMGHVFHNILSRTRFARFHGTSVSRDFVETPSKMLEYWCWEPKVLKRISSHYLTKDPMPDSLIDKIVQSRYVNFGFLFLRRQFFANFDMKVHSDPDIDDFTKLWQETRENTTLVKGGGQPGYIAFPHIMGGQDATTYGYTYSLVFASDMYNTMFKEDPLDPEKGRRYREKVLLPGSTKDEEELLADFLGRPANAEAFSHELFSQSA
ncbi:metallopeptidase MepB [Coniophora puteana RWD-64-598 SS2]|uniref:Metallopeptidase MepB n=1 Tax=Coniophora puteana (strain RWD-64-598) TaxID=741705 RepID=A0A5M3MRL7_CONPW|nr:metallopeptidase MepB [Coniophora puteana RWD-64-598 SS2]EIW81394.1 metallopeptidase MepB [Coniophora puteana RWD-64-598 SS2]